MPIRRSQRSTHCRAMTASPALRSRSSRLPARRLASPDAGRADAAVRRYRLARLRLEAASARRSSRRRTDAMRQALARLAPRDIRGGTCRHEQSGPSLLVRRRSPVIVLAVAAYPAQARRSASSPASRRSSSSSSRRRGHLGAARPRESPWSAVVYLVIAFFFGLAGGIVGSSRARSFFIWFLISARRAGPRAARGGPLPLRAATSCAASARAAARSSSSTTRCACAAAPSSTSPRWRSSRSPSRGANRVDSASLASPTLQEGA